MGRDRERARDAGGDERHGDERLAKQVVARRQQRQRGGEHLQRQAEIEVVADRPFPEQHLTSLDQVHEVVVGELRAQEPEEEREDEGESGARAERRMSRGHLTSAAARG